MRVFTDSRGNCPTINTYSKQEAVNRLTSDAEASMLLALEAIKVRCFFAQCLVPPACGPNARLLAMVEDLLPSLLAERSSARVIFIWHEEGERWALVWCKVHHEIVNIYGTKSNPSGSPQVKT